jgi:triacylglycerol esterase/lipase EstA (alpha/beta hydrolase family)
MNTAKLVRRETSKQHDFQFRAGYYLGGCHLPENQLICCLLYWGVYEMTYFLRFLCVFLLIGHWSVIAQAQESKYVRRNAQNEKVIIFVHGVVGDAISTWTNKAANSYWPQLIASDESFDNSNIYVFNYPTAPLGRNLSINELAENMRLQLNADQVLKHKELVFLSHSMGGLITRSFLLKYRENATKVGFLYFFATPTEGSPTARLATLITKSGANQIDVPNVFGQWLG